jgi:hypothetical protein
MFFTNLDPREDSREVYFIEAEGTGRIKIGVANCARSRLKGLECSCPVDLRLLGVIPTDKTGALERELHLRFAEHRVKGEWFTAAPELRAYIAEHADWPQPRKRRLASGLAEVAAAA